MFVYYYIKYFRRIRFVKALYRGRYLISIGLFRSPKTTNKIKIYLRDRTSKPNDIAFTRLIRRVNFLLLLLLKKNRKTIQLMIITQDG